MSVNEEQAEELEVLESIFEDDEAYKQLRENCVQYKIGNDSSLQSFVVEFVWPPDYPQCQPDINLDAFYNNRLLSNVKEHIVSSLSEQAKSLVGEAMTYTLIDWAKDNFDDLMADQPEKIVKAVVEEAPAKKKEKKEQLTKAQKRKMADRVGTGGERPRGWDWVDVIRHLSQTGKSHEHTDS